MKWRRRADTFCELQQLTNQPTEQCVREHQGRWGFTWSPAVWVLTVASNRNLDHQVQCLTMFYHYTKSSSKIQLWKKKKQTFNHFMIYDYNLCIYFTVKNVCNVQWQLVGAAFLLIVRVVHWMQQWMEIKITTCQILKALVEQLRASMPSMISVWSHHQTRWLLSFDLIRICIHIMSRSKYKKVIVCHQSLTAAQAIDLCHVVFYWDIWASISKIKGRVEHYYCLQFVVYLSIRCYKSYLLDI